MPTPPTQPPPTHWPASDTETEVSWLAQVSEEIQEAHRLLDRHIPRQDARGAYTLAERVALLVDLIAPPAARRNTP